MNLDFSEEQEMLRTMARDFLKTECPKSLVRTLEESESGYSPEIWKKMAALGWQGLPFPEKYGGAGMTFFEFALVMEQMGYNILPGPFLSTVICGLAILEFGTEGQKKRILPEVCAGNMILAFAFTEPSASWDAAHISTSAAAQGGDYAINGTKLFIADAHVAGSLLVVARTARGANPEDGFTVFLVDAGSPGVKIEPQLTMGLDNKCSISFKDVRVPAGNVVGEVNRGWKLVQSMMTKGAAAKVAEMSGFCQATLDMSTGYAKDRVQYERTIASFQVIQHYLADMWGQADRTRNIAWEVAWKVGAGVATPTEVAAAKSWANEACRWVTTKAVHVHGAIGITRDHDVGLYYRRARVAELEYGDADYHQKVVIHELGI